MGKTKLPTKLKVMRGTSRVDRVLSDEMPIVSIDSIPMPPDCLKDERSQECWIEICAMLVPIGLLDIVGARQIEMYCRAYEEYVLCEDIIQGQGVKEMLGDGKRRQGVFGVRNEAFDRMRKIGNEFGFTPVSKTKIGIGTRREKKNNMKVSLR